jgi:hypothetical protein
MKRYFKYLILFGLLLFSTISVFCQTYNMSGISTTYTGCTGTFYDSGGSAGNYTNNQNRSVTFCSGNGQPIFLNFTQFSLEANYDFMYIYNGPNITFPLLGTYTGTNSPGTIVASSGCITVRFTSDGSFNNPGWAATIGCGNPPPNPNMSNSSITACSGNFFDSGGAGANYGNSQTLKFK